MTVARRRWPDAGGHFGPYGGRYVPETLMEPLRELEAVWDEARDDAGFQRELRRLNDELEARVAEAASAGGDVYAQLMALAHAQNKSPNGGTFIPATFLRVTVSV